MAFHWIHRQYQEKSNGAGQREPGEDAPSDGSDIPF
jgi:hypothetical protein